MNFELRIWTGRFDTYLKIQSDVTVAICDALEKANITVPFPQRDLHVKSVPSNAGLEIPEITGGPRDE